MRRYQKGSDRSATRVRKAERGSAGRESLASNCRSLSLSRPERAREATGGSKGHAVESGPDCLSEMHRGVVVLCPLRSRFTKDHRGYRVSPNFRGSVGLSPASGEDSGRLALAGLGIRPRHVSKA